MLFCLAGSQLPQEHVSHHTAAAPAPYPHSLVSTPSCSPPLIHGHLPPPNASCQSSVPSVLCRNPSHLPASSLQENQWVRCYVASQWWMYVPDNGCQGNSTEKFMACGHRLKSANLHQKFTNPHEIFTCALILFPFAMLACCPSDWNTWNTFSSSHSHVSNNQQLNVYWAYVISTFFCLFVFEGSSFFLFFRVIYYFLWFMYNL